MINVCQENKHKSAIIAVEDESSDSVGNHSKENSRR